MTLNLNGKKQKVLQKIADAFSRETFPRGDELFILSANHIFDAKSAADGLDYENWNQIPQAILIRNRDRIPYLTASGYRFLLPAFLTMAIEYPREADVLVPNVISSLIPRSDSSNVSNEMLIERTNLLSSTQAEAILSFFEAYTDIYPIKEWSFDAKDTEQVEKGIQFWKSRVNNLRG